MRRNVLVFTCLLMITFVSHAQQKGKQLANALTDKFASSLKLDSSQKRKVQAANEQYINELGRILQKDDFVEKTRELKRVRSEHEGTLQNIFTKEQQKQYEMMREEQREKFSEAAAQKLSEDVTLKMQNKLNLSVKQSTQADSINKKTFQTLFASLMNDYQQGLRKLKAVRQAAEERDAAMKEILNNEQYKGYLEMNEEAKEKMKEKRKGIRGE